MILGALLHLAYTHYNNGRDRTDLYYYDSDDLPDEMIFWRNGENVEHRHDRYKDGRWDYKTYYRNELPVSDEFDENFDGKWDGAHRYWASGSISGGEGDTDFNGVPDVAMTFTNGILLQTGWRPNGTNLIVLRQLFRNGVLDEELRDQNGDGLFEVSVKYNAFDTPIRTNNLPPFATQTP